MSLSLICRLCVAEMSQMVSHESKTLLPEAKPRTQGSLPLKSPDFAKTHFPMKMGLPVLSLPTWRHSTHTSRNDNNSRQCSCGFQWCQNAGLGHLFGFQARIAPIGERPTRRRAVFCRWVLAFDNSSGTVGSFRAAFICTQPFWQSGLAYAITDAVEWRR